MNNCRFNLIAAVNPKWKQDREPDPNHFYRRTLTVRYQAKKKVLHYLWIAVLTTIMINPFIGYAAAITLLMTFFSFSFLDETEQ